MIAMELLPTFQTLELVIITIIPVGEMGRTSARLL